MSINNAKEYSYEFIQNLAMLKKGQLDLPVTLTFERKENVGTKREREGDKKESFQPNKKVKREEEINEDVTDKLAILKQLLLLGKFN